ncbi:COMM domain-containing protein 8-like [Tachyglossus aculeatus]|uniref:COMM domain-containing protein 8-like n=1 Tax=Tachyglossus aculeatus TaxID=9261 RepID=UPI0018F28A47|nr:COMM domain-containing protein 8-like [Tachyglossus aculeatus]
MEAAEGASLWRLQKIPAELGAQLLHRAVDSLCGRAAPQDQNGDQLWDPAEWEAMREDIAVFFKTTVGHDRPDEEALQQLGQLSPGLQETVMQCLKGRKEEIRQALLGEVTAISSAQLQDFDWQLKLALSSDKLATLQMPLLNLDLDVRENGEVKPYSIEMSKDELQKLISALEAANKDLKQKRPRV